MLLRLRLISIIAIEHYYFSNNQQIFKNTAEIVGNILPETKARVFSLFLNAIHSESNIIYLQYLGPLFV